MARRSFLPILLIGLSLAALSACTTPTEMTDTAGAGQGALCRAGASLGPVIIYPRTSWRPDQVDPAGRAQLAERAIAAAFADLPCGTVSRIHRIDVPRDWHEADMRAKSRAAGAKTLILIQVFELGANLALAGDASPRGPAETSLQMRAIDLSAGRPILDIERHRKSGGAIGSAGDLEAELAALVRSLITGAGT